MESPDSPIAQVRTPAAAQFENQFHIEDLEVFDDETLRIILSNRGFGLSGEKLAQSLQGASDGLIQRIRQNLSPSERSSFTAELRRSIPEKQVEAARRYVLDGLFWELTYWKTPELYEELTEGEQIHPGIFGQLEPDIRDKVVLDAGAGGGRATFECVHYGARMVYAVEPSPGLLRILQQKLACQQMAGRIVACRGHFDKLPLAGDSVDTAISCSAFTAEPRLPLCEEMRVHFRSMQSALRCARHFYARNPNVVRYLLKERKPEIPFSVLGYNPPCDYCWLLVE